MQKVYEKEEYIILGCKNKRGYIVYNTNKKWHEGHTHIREFKQARYLIDCAIKHKLPRDINKYFLVSLTRISEDPVYVDLLQDRINRTPNAKDKYVNKKGVK